MKFRPEFCDDLLGGTLPFGLELDQKIAGVRFSDCERKSRAGPPRIAFHLGSGTQNFFRLQKLSVGFGKAGSIGRVVVNHKAALVHGREKLACEIAVEKYSCTNDSTAGKQCEAPISQRYAYRSLIQANDPA